MLEAIDWPKRLSATVTEPGEEPRLHGYSVERDLARFYGFADVLYLALTGDLPAGDAAAGLQVAMAFLSAVGIEQGPTHAAFLARLFNAPARAVIQVASAALAERSHFEVEVHGELLRWLDTGSGPPPRQYVSSDAAELRSVERLRNALPPSLAAGSLAHPLTRSAALVALLHSCGLRRAEQIELVWTLAALGTAFAEGMAAKPFAFREYAMDTPAFRYRSEP